MAGRPQSKSIAKEIVLQIASGNNSLDKLEEAFKDHPRRSTKTKIRVIIRGRLSELVKDGIIVKDGINYSIPNSNKEGSF